MKHAHPCRYNSRGVTVSLRPQGIRTPQHQPVVVHVDEDNRIVTVDEVQEMFDSIEQESGGHKVLLMVTVGIGTSMSNEARAFA